MTTPHEEHPAAAQATPEQAAAGVPGTPAVSTAPPRSRWRLGRVPARLGRARTSTVVLAVVWLLVALLWLDVRPPSAQITPTSGTGGGTGQTTAPARTSSSAPTSTAPTSTAPTSTPPPTRTTGAEPSATSTAPASTTTVPGRTSGPSGSAVPTPTSGSSGGTTLLPTSAAPTS